MSEGSAGPRRFDDDRLMADLDFYRSAVVRKVEGLSDVEAVAQRTPTGLTLAGVVKHLTWVERLWFEIHIAGIEFEPGETDASFQLDDGETAATVVANYQAMWAQAADILSSRTFDDLTLLPHWHLGIVDVRYALVHLVKETSRHLGHMDILREMTDGTTGF